MVKPVETEPTNKAKDLLQYRIVVEGELDESWSRWLGQLSFENISQQHRSKRTMMIASVADQAALRGLLNKIWDLNLTLISLKLCELEYYGDNYER